MTHFRTDLYLGGDLGSWVLQQIHPTAIGTVVTPDSDLAALARSRDLRVSVDPPLVHEFDGVTMALSVHYPKILPSQVLGRYRAAYNLHPGYLPWGRGYYPAFWALLEGTPAGATLHQMTERLDAGPIVDQIQVAYSENDTGGSLLQRVREAERSLFKHYWPKFTMGEPLPTNPQTGDGSYHSRAAFYAMKRPRDWHTLNAETLVKRIRCLTVPGYTGMELPLGDRIVHFTLQDVA